MRDADESSLYRFLPAQSKYVRAHNKHFSVGAIFTRASLAISLLYLLKCAYFCFNFHSIFVCQRAVSVLHLDSYVNFCVRTINICVPFFAPVQFEAHTLRCYDNNGFLYENNRREKEGKMKSRKTQKQESKQKKKREMK